MSNTAMWSMIVGFFLPTGIAFVQQQKWQTAFRATVTFVLCLLAAVGTVLIQVGSWDWHKWIQSALLVLVTAVSTYESFWKKTGVAPAIENATTPKKPAA